MPSQKKPAPPKDFTPLQKIGIIVGIVLAGSAIWFFSSGQAAVTVGIELTIPSAACPNVGNLCADGSIYAGQSNLHAMYVTDVNQHTDTQWKTSFGADDINPDSLSDGEANHDYRSGTLSDFPAFDLCENLDRHGHIDWYLPSIDELHTLYLNKVAIDLGSTEPFVEDDYWSSSERDIGASNTAWSEDFSSGTQDQYSMKTSYFDVRCVRTGTVAEATIAETITSNKTLEDGLVGHWSFDGPDVDWSSTTAEIKDRSGRGNHGDTQGGMTTQSVTPGKMGQGMKFDGVDDYINMGNKAAFIIGTAVTYSAWVRPTKIKMQQGLILNKWKANFEDKSLYYHSNGRFGFYLFDEFGGSGLESNTSYTNLGQWYHVSGVYDGTKAYIYIDGEEDGNKEASGDIRDNNGAMFVGYNPVRGEAESKLPFAGELDDVRIYNRALSADEVKRLYGLGATTHIAETITSNKTLENGLVGHWTFDGPDVDWSSTTAEIKDRSGEGNHGDALNGMTTQSVTPGKMGQGMKFDGVDDYIDLGGNNLVTGSQNRTFVAWIKPNSYYVDNKAIFTLGTLSSGEAWRVVIDSSGMLRLAIEDTGYTTSMPVALNEWSFVGVTLDGSTVEDHTLYVNGQSESATGVSIINTGTTDAHIGELQKAHDKFGTGVSLDGSLDDVRIYNRALSPNEVKRLYGLGAGSH